MRGWRRSILALAILGGVSSHAAAQPVQEAPDADPGVDHTDRAASVPDEYRRRVVAFRSEYPPGTIVVSTQERFLYLVMPNNLALRYGIGVGRDGFQWGGLHKITRKAEWPDWTPPSEMLKRQPGIPVHMAGGLDNPLGARALYLGSTLYRIHGTAEPWTIGTAVSSGCIRMRNEDVMDLYERVKVGTKVVVI